MSGKPRWESLPAMVVQTIRVSFLTAGVLLILVPLLRLVGNIVCYIDPKNASEKIALAQVGVQALGGLLLIGTIYAAIRNVQINSQQLRVAQEGQITDRFTKAIEHLGDERLAVRVGGIYALERIARDSCRGREGSFDRCRDHLAVLEVLTSYVRDNSPAPADTYDPSATYKLETDIQAILTVLGRRDASQRASEDHLVPAGPDLHGTNLRGVTLVEPHLEKSNLVDAHLDRANLMHGHLEEAHLMRAHLEGASLQGAHLEGASLQEARLEGSQLWRARLEGASLMKTHLEGASLQEAHLQRAPIWEAHLEGADLKEAHLEEAQLNGAFLMKADLRGAYLKGTRLKEAHLEGANLNHVIGLTQEQIDSSFMDDETVLPEKPGPDGQPYQRSTRLLDEDDVSKGQGV